MLTGLWTNPFFWIIIYGVDYIITILLISLLGMEKIEKRVPRIIILMFILIVFVIPPIILPFTKGPKMPIPTPILLSIGIIILVISLIMKTASQKQIGTSPGLKGKSGLVTSGIYRWIRHPLYISNMLLALAILFKSIYALLFSIPYALLYLPIIHFEEKDLSEKYGEEYEEYKKKVPWRMIPKVI